MCVCHVLSCVPLFVAPWTVAHQAPLSMEFSRQVAISSSRVYSQPRDQTCVSCIGRQILYLMSHQGSPFLETLAIY